MAEKKLNLKTKVIGLAIWMAIVYIFAKYLSNWFWGAVFPTKWIIEFEAFALVGFIFFLILDMPSLKDIKSGGQIVRGLIGTYLLASLLFIIITNSLPSFDIQEDIARINKPPLKIGEAAGPELIAAGREVFDTYKCFNCHKVWEEGSSDRGPNLGLHQIGLYPEDYIREQIVDPRKQQAPGFTDEKSVKAMPDYYGDDIEEGEKKALIAYLSSLKSDKRIPAEGKLGEQWTWWDDPKIIAEGKEVYEGITHPEVNCSVCHGKDGIPMMTGSFDFRDANRPDKGTITTDPDMLKQFTNIPYKDWTDELYFNRVTKGVVGSPMASWGDIVPHISLWKAMTYERTFSDPLEKRTAKKPVAPPDFH